MPGQRRDALAVADGVDAAAEGVRPSSTTAAATKSHDEQHDRREPSSLAVMNQRISGEEKPAGVPCE